MKKKSAHEPKAKVMSAAEAWEDSQQTLLALRQNWREVEPFVELQIPLSVLLSAIDNFKRDELLILQKRIKTRLAA